jgi:hypothetical protein
MCCWGDEQVLRVAVERMIGRLSVEKQVEVLAQLVAVLPFLERRRVWVEVPVVGGGTRRVEVCDLLGEQARLHQLLLVFEEVGEQELYQQCEQRLLVVQRLEAEQLAWLVAVMRG